MKYLIIKIKLTVAILILSANTYGGDSSATTATCRSGEKAYFSCKTRNSKLISLCASEGNNKISSLTYYFGDITNPELIQTSSSETNFDPFRFNHYFRYGVDYSRVSFSRGGYRYEIYIDYDLEKTPAESYGISVASLATPDREIKIECYKEAQANLSPLFTILKCDKKNSLGCGK
ncbi:hypothetical protein [Metapseudomonas otitidis]|uniref:hypothetical protein n=1 Tax=Metapseudomonas otitidis TaxID=319939 RepID=UPI0028122DB1|nr:hypothetical protein [Pseudomonas otitidis]WMR32423.1 hypothetical protein QT513_25165 [Pseudomonas otitidis]